MDKELNGVTAKDWLKFNYNLETGNRVVGKTRTGIIVNVVETDNIGHFRTQYPVVIVVDFVTEDPQKMTIEEIMGF